jgi:beta-galactosidase
MKNTKIMQNTLLFPKIYHGGDYNPEQWPENVWDDDVRLMREANVNIATLPVFGWVSLQPDEETYTFDWLDRIVDKLGEGGISICLATATGSVPAWLDQKYPDVLRVDIEGRKVRHGGRHTFCPNSLNFRRLAGILVTKLAHRYAAKSNLAVWHVSNEYGNICYCDQCADAFREWLKLRYGTLDEVNKRWYSQFWGHRYTDWSQIETPVLIGERSMQPLLIDYDRFQSESLLECFKMERDIIRGFSPTVPITTNLMGSFKPLNYQEWAKELDIVSWDSYPPRGAKPSDIAFQHSLMRGLKEGAPWMLMEQTPSQQNWQAYNALKRPGVMRLWSYQALAHGADSVMYFQWRRSRGCCEKYHGAVVEHAARTDARVFQEVRELGRELEALGTKTIGSLVQNRAAILFDWENWWAVEYSSGPSVDLKYVPQALSYFEALHKNGIVADVISPSAKLSEYSMVVAPVLYMLKPGVVAHLTEYVRGGGSLIVTYFSGIVDETDHVFEGGYPGPLRDLLGIWVEEVDVLSPQEHNAVRFANDSSVLPGTEVPCGLLCERIHPELGASVIATYVNDFYAGEPAITAHGFGDGVAYYIGTQLAEEALASMLTQMATLVGIRPLSKQQPGMSVEVTERQREDGTTLTFVLNHGENSVSVELTRPGKRKDLITGQTFDGVVELPKYGVAILEPA